MGRFTSLIAVVAVAAAACAGTGSPATADQATPDQATATPAATSLAPATSSPAAPAPIAVNVAFDGTTCSYTGPTVVPSGSTLVWTLRNAPELDMWTGSTLGVEAVVDGTTWDQVLSGSHKTSVAPPWVILEDERLLWFNDANKGMMMETTMTRSAYLVVCFQSPQGADTSFPAALIRVLKG